MPRARTHPDHLQTAAIQTHQENGCLSVLFLPPISVIVISLAFGSFAWNAVPPDQSLSSSGIATIFTEEIQYWSKDITRWADESGLDPNLIATVMQIESCGDPHAVSNSGALGLFQVMPFHFKPGDDPQDANTNAARGLSYLARSLEASGGDARLALAGYNGGIGIIHRGEWGWSDQTKRYVRYGWPIFTDARAGLETTTSVTEWHDRYGASLCRQAHRRLGLP